MAQQLPLEFAKAQKSSTQCKIIFGEGALGQIPNPVPSPNPDRSADPTSTLNQKQTTGTDAKSSIPTPTPTTEPTCNTTKARKSSTQCKIVSGEVALGQMPNPVPSPEPDRSSEPASTSNLTQTTGNDAKSSIPPPTPTTKPTCKTANCTRGKTCLVWPDGVRGTSSKAVEVALEACRGCKGFLHGICGEGEPSAKWCPACSSDSDSEVRLTYGTHLPVCTP
jgi:hypothetical protein